FEHAIGTEYGGLDFGTVGQHGDDDLRARCGVAARRAGLRTGSGHVGDARWDDVVDDERLARFQKVFRHGTAHDAEADESDLRHEEIVARAARILTAARPYN